MFVFSHPFITLNTLLYIMLDYCQFSCVVCSDWDLLEITFSALLFYLSFGKCPGSGCDLSSTLRIREH